MSHFDIPRDKLLIEVADLLPRHCPELDGDIGLRLVNTTTRVFSTICEVATTKLKNNRTFLVKITHPEEALPICFHSADVDDLHRLFVPSPDPVGFEHKALEAIGVHLKNHGDARFCPLMTYGTVLGDQGFVMEKVAGKSLASQMRSLSFGRDRTGVLKTLIESAGAWLRALHEMPAPPHTRTIYGGLDTIRNELANVVEFLKACPTRHQDEISAFESGLFAALSELESSDIRIGINHHDFAPRNILVLPDNRITVIDTTLEERRPVFEDIATFLIDLRINKFQLISRGMAFSGTTIRKLEAALLHGYFRDETIPWKSVLIYQARHLLIVWAAQLWEKSHGPQPAISKRMTDAARIKTIRSTLAETLNELRTTNHSSGQSPGPSRSIVPEIKNRAVEYFSSGRPSSVTIKRVSDYKYSSITECVIDFGDHQKSLIVKKARNPLFEMAPTEAWIDQNDRPRLTKSMSPHEEIVMEAAAMRSVHDHFCRHGDPMLKSIRVLDFIESDFALVLEKIDLPTVEQFLKAGDLNEKIGPAFHNIGRWLKVFHGLSVAHTQLRDTNAREYMDNVCSYIEFLKLRIGHVNWLNKFQHRINQLIGAGILDAIPIGTNHGDFAAHNVFIGTNFEIFGFDTLARWRKPIFEDLAYFQCVLFDQAGTLNPEVRERMNLAFLNGYFNGQPVPQAAIRLFQILIILDKWSSYVFSQGNAKGFSRTAKKVRLIHRNRKMIKRLDACLDLVERDSGVFRSQPVNSTSAPEGI